MSDKPSMMMKHRLMAVIGICVLALLGYMLVNMFHISVTEAEKYQQLANSQQLRSKVINATRGSIYDANMQFLAKSATVYTVIIDPGTLRSYMSDEETIAELKEKGTYVEFDDIVAFVAQTLDMDEDTVRDRFNRDGNYQELKKNVEKAVADKITEYADEHSLGALACIPATKRFYPENDLAANVIGHLHYDGYGIYGLEAYYEEYLAGVDGRILTAKDSAGNDIPYRYKQNYDAQDGDSLVLNMDRTVQYYLEKALKEGVAKNNPADRASGIVMNAKTGAIYAMATVPGYDLNEPAEIYDEATAAQIEKITDEDEKQEATSAAWGKQWTNKAISELYYPGSVFKVITGSSALDEQVIDLDDTFSGATSIDVDGETFHNWSTRDFGAQTLQNAMTNSINPAFIQIGQKLGIDKFFQYFKAFGLTEKTGIDLPGETGSLYIDGDVMTNVDLAASSFGQANKITPIQMITAYAAAINGGYLMVPQVVDKIIDSNGNVVKDITSEVKRQVISEETSEEMRTILETVVNTSQGGNSYIQGYRIGGKSGTSQKIDEDKTGNTYVASYCAFAPADDPEIIILVMVDNPQGENYYGSLVAAPIVTAALTDILPYLGFFPEYTDEQLEQIQVSVSNFQYVSVKNAKKTIEDSYGLSVEVIGDGDTVIKQIPASGSVQRGGTVLLYTEEDEEIKTTTVPNLSGLTLEQAKSAMEDAGLNLSVKGSAVYEDGAVAGADQSVAANTEINQGEIVEVTFYAGEATSQ